MHPSYFSTEPLSLFSELRQTLAHMDHCNGRIQGSALSVKAEGIPKIKPYLLHLNIFPVPLLPLLRIKHKHFVNKSCKCSCWVKLHRVFLSEINEENTDCLTKPSCTLPNLFTTQAQPSGTALIAPVPAAQSCIAQCLLFQTAESIRAWCPSVFLLKGKLCANVFPNNWMSEGMGVNSFEMALNNGLY